ncbi:molybdopterin-binding protein [Bacillus licheniformis]|nr:molybdopterin-binding protein [Bacillus licheniformis]
MKLERKAEIIAVGSELLLGQIVNTNAQFISRHLAESALTSFITRRWETIRSALNKSFRQRSKGLTSSFSGGLGPTKDDLTKETIAEVVGRPLKLDDEAFESIQDYFKKRTGRCRRTTANRR